MSDERVLVVPAELVAAAAQGRDCWSWDAERNAAWIDELEAAGRFVARSQCETDESVRQVIPYLLLRSAEGAYFVYRRLRSGGEARLYDLHSLGVGGHINDERSHAGLSFRESVLRPRWVAEGLQRELAEELELPASDGEPLGELVLQGFLALSETPVDRVHVGVVVRVELAAGRAAACRVRETDRLAAVGWLDARQLRELAESVTFEGWSRTLIAAGLP